MRDIRDDLRERLNSVGGRKQAIQAKFDTEMQGIEQEERLVAGMLEIEDARFPAPSGPQVSHPAPQQSLPDFFFSYIQRGRPTKDELERLASEAGYFGDGQSPGRSTNLTLVNMTRGGRIQEVDGRYESARKPEAP